MRKAGEALKRRWDSLRRLASRPLLGWMCLAVVFVVFGVAGLVEGNPGGYLVFGSLVAAAAMNACTWLSAVLTGRTRQLRSSWLSLIAFPLASALAAIASPRRWGDGWIVTGSVLLILGFPTSWCWNVVSAGMAAVMDMGSNYFRVADDASYLVLLALDYLQAFILLPRLFRWVKTRWKHGDELLMNGNTGPVGDR